MRGRLFNLFKLFCVVASGSLSFSFVDLPSPLLFSPVFAFPRLLFNGDGRILLAVCDVEILARLAGRFMFKRDVGRGAIEAFSVGLSVLLSCSSFDSVTATGAALSVVDGDGFPRFLKLN